MALVFDRDLDAQPGRVDVIAPQVRRVLAPNAGPFTYLGTGTYIVGEGEVAVIDPGPNDPAHIDAIVAALGGETVSHIFVTHTHADHSPGARLLQERTGATVVGCSAHPAEEIAAQERRKSEKAAERAKKESLSEHAGESEQSEHGGQSEHRGQSEHSEHTEEPFDGLYRPDIELTDGDVLETPRWSLEAVATPGHIANHLCFAFREQSTLFSGDHVMAWSTSVVSPPGGDLVDYLISLEKVRVRAESTYWPTHGPAVRDPKRFVGELIAHRHHRTQQILSALSSGPKTIPQLVAEMYVGLDERLVKAAGRSVLSHLYALLREDRLLAVGARPDANPYETDEAVLYALV